MPHVKHKSGLGLGQRNWDQYQSVGGHQQRSGCLTPQKMWDRPIFHMMGISEKAKRFKQALERTCLFDRYISLWEGARLK